jgi:hypothetical protein
MDEYSVCVLGAGTAMQLDNKITQLENTPRSELIAEWLQICGIDPPEFLSNSLLIRILAYRLQIQQYGGLTPTNQAILKDMLAAFKENPKALFQKISPKIGTRLRRLWKGKIYEVICTRDGFIYDGVSYRSLSEVAGIITGNHWNGPMFFGLRPTNKS